MRAVLQTNDPVELSFAEHLLAEAGIGHVVFDGESSIMDGSTGMVPRRLMVAADEFEAASVVLRDGLCAKSNTP